MLVHIGRLALDRPRICWCDGTPPRPCCRWCDYSPPCPCGHGFAYRPRFLPSSRQWPGRGPRPAPCPNGISGEGPHDAGRFGNRHREVVAHPPLIVGSRREGFPGDGCRLSTSGRTLPWSPCPTAPASSPACRPTCLASPAPANSSRWRHSILSIRRRSDFVDGKHPVPLHGVTWSRNYLQTTPKSSGVSRISEYL